MKNSKLNQVFLHLILSHLVYWPNVEEAVKVVFPKFSQDKQHIEYMILIKHLSSIIEKEKGSNKYFKEYLFITMGSLTEKVLGELFKDENKESFQHDKYDEHAMMQFFLIKFLKLADIADNVGNVRMRY